MGFGAVILVLMLVIFNFLPPVLMSIKYWQLGQVHRHALLKMEMAGGLTADIQQQIINTLQNWGFDISRVTVIGTPAVVDYGGTIELTISYDCNYDQYAFSSFTLAKNTTIVPMQVHAASISFTYQK